jgi:methylmalonyl-CoA mutase, C-terminal domain
VAKPGLDGHDRGAHLIARLLRDSGMEVIYGGLRQTPPMIVSTAVAEDVDIIGLSILTGGHLGLTRKVLEQLAMNNAADIPVVVGGVIPDEDIPTLQDIGAAAVFPNTTPHDHIPTQIRAIVEQRRADRDS